MPEFRKDPLTGRWRIVAEGRSARPNEYAPGPALPSNDADCPFCEGREARTPPEVAAVRGNAGRPNGPGWTVRAVPNRFPSVAPASGPPLPAGAAPFQRHAATGAHEVIIESPGHSPDLPYLAPEQLRSVFRFLRERVAALTALPGISSVVLFENRGPESGGTLPHPHAQIVATELPSPRVEEEAEGFRRGSAGTAGECRLEAIVAAESGARERVVSSAGAFTAFAPFASEFPYETWIVPKRHANTFAESTDREVDELAVLLPSVLRALDGVRPRASYNWYVHGRASRTDSPAAFHWHVEVAPRLVRPDGYELGSGVSVNPVPPERAAAELRKGLTTSGRPAARKP